MNFTELTNLPGYETVTPEMTKLIMDAIYQDMCQKRKIIEEKEGPQN